MKTKRIERQELAKVINGKCASIFSHNRKKFYMVKLWSLHPSAKKKIKALEKRAKALGAIHHEMRDLYRNGGITSFTAHFPLN